MTRHFKYALFLFLLLPFLFAGRLDYLKGVSGGHTVDDCSGTLVFSWYANLDDSTPTVTDGCPDLQCGCADTDEVGAATGTPTFSNAYGGGYALYINALDEYMHFDETGANFDDFRITFDVYVVSFPGAGKDTGIFSMTSAATDSIHITLNETGTIQVLRYCDSEADTVLVSSLSTGVWYNNCEYRTKVGVAGSDHKLTIGGEAPDEDDDDLKASVTADNGIYIGEVPGDTISTYLIRNVKIYAVSGY